MAKQSKRDKTKQYERKFKSLEDKSPIREPKIVFSLSKLDGNQGQTFDDWEKNGLLSQAMNRIRNLCDLTVSEAKRMEVVTCYNKVPFPTKSNFKHPRHIPNDITWCSFHIKGKECLIGYFEENIFNIVFLDKNHEFWITTKKNT